MAQETIERRETAETRVDEMADGARPTDVRTDPYAGIAAARENFGGIDVPATLVGMLTGLSTTLILAGLVGAAVGAVGYQTGLESDAEDLSTASVIGGAAVLFVAFLIGGWAAGRIARYDGARNGLGAAVSTLVFAAILSGLGAWLGSEYDVFSNVDLPQWFSTGAVTTTALLSGVAVVLAMVVGAVIGGIWGEHYHRRADRTILANPPRRQPAPAAEKA